MTENEFNALDERFESIDTRLKSCEAYCKAMSDVLLLP